MAPGRKDSIYLENVSHNNLMLLKKLNDAVFPVRYSENYYADVLASGEFSKLAYYRDICVGAITCRPQMKEDGTARLYIMTIGVLAPYRQLGIGTRMLNNVFELSSRLNICEFYLHAQTSNEAAIRFYRKFGFETTQVIQNFYTNIPVGSPDCCVLTKYVAPNLKSDDEK